jgi:hypothetical protein
MAPLKLIGGRLLLVYAGSPKRGLLSSLLRRNGSSKTLLGAREGG